MNSPCRLLTVLAAALAPAFAQAQTIFIDFGSNTTSATGWNNFSSTAVSGSPVALLYSGTEAVENFTYAITNDFQGTSTQTGATFGEFVTTSTNDYFYGQTSNPLGQITFGGFDPGTYYTFTFVSYRNTTGSDIRSTEFNLLGLTSDSTATNSLNNLTTVSITSIRPDANGVFVLDVTKGQDSTNSSGFYYINAMKIEAVGVVPEPASASVLAATAALLAAIGLRRRRRAA